MPPRKKAATADDAPKATATRASTRTKAPVVAAPPAPKAKPATKAKPKAAKGKGKRARDSGSEDEDVEDDDDDEEYGSKVKKPASKKVKTVAGAKPSSKKGKAKAKAKEDEPEEENEKEKKEEKKAEDGIGAEDEDEKVEEPKKMVTIIKRGAAPVDPASQYVNTHQVYVNEQGVWDAMLNQTDVSQNQNKNKFYVLQLLHPIGNNSSCILFTRWGRVGENGQTQTKGPFASQTAVYEFKKQFRAKAATNWEDRVGMTAIKGKYMWIERAFENESDEKEEEEEGGSKKEPEKIPNSVLAPELQALCNLIFSTSIIDAHLSSMNYDARKLPLGKLAKSTILSGFSALKRLSEVLEKPNGDEAKAYNNLREAYEHLSSAYYSIIPHDFGRQRPHVIDNLVTLKRELELVDALGDMEIAQKLIQSSILADEHGNPLNPLDAHFRSLGLSSMDPVNASSSEFKVLQAYARDTHGETHRHLQVEVFNAFRVERNGETDAWEKAGHNKLGDGERLLLWHGSRTTNFAGILKQGLRIAPPEAPVTGYMFGKGVYFADMMSKSANYCYSYLSNNTGLLLLCEVAAKPFYEQTNAQYNADQHCRAQNKMSTKGIGRTQPVKWKDAGNALGNEGLVGCHMPDGPGQNIDAPGVHLQYNEYIVYDPSQIRLKYLLMVKM